MDDIQDTERKRLLRAERRHKQRLANVERAAKMHAVRNSDPQIPYSCSLPHFASKFHIGCSGWYYRHWKDKFYPDNVASNRWFKIYEENFKTVELNAPFYSWPTLATVKTWVRQAESDFVYTIKVCELITHIKRFEDTQTLIRDFYFIADMLGPRMGCFLFQLPPSCRYSQVLLTTILQQLDPRYRNVIEFRHKSWWNEDVYMAFRAAGVMFCSCSAPRLPDELIKTADDIYVRFHGSQRWYRHDYSDEELLVWAERIQQSGAKNVWGYFNNDREGYAIKNAKSLISLLNGSTSAEKIM